MKRRMLSSESQAVIVQKTQPRCDRRAPSRNPGAFFTWLIERDV